MRINPDLINFVHENTPEIVFWVKKDGKVFFANNTAATFYKCKPEAFFSEPVYAFLTNLDPQRWQLLFDEIKSAQSTIYPVNLRCKSKNRALLLSSFIPAEDAFVIMHIFPESDNAFNKELFETLTGANEISDSANLEAKIDELKVLNKKLKKEVNIRRDIEKNLKEYSEELKIKNLELEQFAYVASHDLQEPLRMIASFTQLLGNRYKGKLDVNADEFIGFILDGANRMQRLINDLLIYSRIGRKGQDMELVPLRQIIETVKDNIILSLDETDTQIAFDEEVIVYGDKGQLMQLFQNLLSNAIKFRQPDIVPQVKITATDEQAHYKICVEDNGIGIDMQHKDRIFNIFQRLHNQDKYPGTGIGLAICKKIVERHGGEIWVESTPGKGAMFCFTLRKKQPEPAEEVNGEAFLQ